MREPLLSIQSFNSFAWVSTSCQTQAIVHQLFLPCQVPSWGLNAACTDHWHVFCPFQSILEQGRGIKTFDALLMRWMNLVLPKHTYFPSVSAVKNLPANAGDTGSFPWLGRSPGVRKCQPTPMLLPGKSHGQRSLLGYGHGVVRVRHNLAIEQAGRQNLHTLTHMRVSGRQAVLTTLHVCSPVFPGRIPSNS